MKRVIKWVFTIVLLCAIVIVGYRFWPFLSAHLFSESSSKWITQKLEESISAQNELLVLDVQTSRVETVTKEAWLIGTVQKVEIPYTFSMHYSVDMNKAAVTVNGTNITIHIPVPKPGYQKLMVDEDNMKKSDWLFPLTAEGYSDIKAQLEERLFREYATSEACLSQAKENAITGLTKQYEALLNQLFVNQANPYRIKVECTETE